MTCVGGVLYPVGCVWIQRAPTQSVQGAGTPPT